MSDEQTTEEEPSIEEILDSIRQIISDDDEEGGEEAAPAPEPEAAPEPPPEPTPIEPEDVIELTEKADPEPAPEPEPEPEPAPEPEPEPEPAPIEPPVEVDMADIEDNADSILTNTAQSAAYDGFSELARKTAVEHNGITLEEIVRTELNPMLKDWLDKHLPNIIDRLVKEELERISKRAETDLDEF